MSINNQSSGLKKIHIHLRVLFKNHSSVPYLLKWLLICSVIGICVGSASAGFLQSLNRITNYREAHTWLIVLLPVGGLLVGLLYHYYGKTVEAGNNLLIDTINDPKEIIPFRMAPFIYIGTMITHLTGGSAGREGTALQMAGAISDQLSKPLRLTPSDRQVLLIAAIAAGFGSVFGTPLTGAIFALEVCVVGRVRYHAIFPAFAAAMIASLVTDMWHVHHTTYYVGNMPDVSVATIVYVAFAGIIFGLCSAAFTRVMHFTSSLFKTVIKFAPFRPLIGGIIVLIAVYAIGTTKYIGLGIPTIVQSFDQRSPVYYFVLKMLFTIVTLSAGFKGGEVTPLFFIGATLGSALSFCIPLPTALLAGVGFVAVFAGATNTPIACTIMAIELFGVECAMYAAIACSVGYLFSGNTSIYNRQPNRSSKYWKLLRSKKKWFDRL